MNEKMQQYEVSGEVKFVRHCECELCPGHTAHIMFKADIEAEGDQEAHAILGGEGEVIEDMIWAREPKDINADSWEWVGTPTVQRISEDMRLRRAGAPMLPGFAPELADTRRPQ